MEKVPLRTGVLMMHILALVAVLGCLGQVSSEPDPVRVVFTQIPVASAPTLGGATAELPSGSRLMALRLDDASEPVNLAPGFASAGLAQVSCDAKRVLFVGKRDPAGPFHVWELDLARGEVRRVTDEGDKAVAGRRPAYVSTTFTLDAKAPVDLIAFARNLGSGTVFTSRLDGSRPERITFGPYGATDPFLLSDGRLLICEGLGLPETASTPAGGRSTALLSINTDGTELFPFAALHEPPALRTAPSETPDGRVVYVESELGGADCGGSLVSVSRTRSLRTRRVVASGSDGRYRSPWPLDARRLMASYLPRDGHSYGLWILDAATGARLEQVVDDPAWHEVGAVTVAVRPRPAGRSSVVDRRRDHGWLYCLNSYRSDYPEAKSLRHGQIKKVRFIAAGSDPTGADSTILGEIPVEEDGSFFAEVPPEVPLRMETLDEHGNVLMAMQRWVWIMPREGRGCIGCHEDREMVPPNFHPDALRNPAHLVRPE